MGALFDAVVRFLLDICQETGLSYSEINILIYTFLIPASWWGIVWGRLRVWPWLWVLHLGLPVLYYLERERLAEYSAQFYKANTEAILWLGGGTEWGYIQWSILIGIITPAIIYLALWLSPQRALKPLYLGLIAGNFAWYLWTWLRFD
jgi:uncharacterized SAM-binding protein YcdF (DUF218 family)